MKGNFRLETGNTLKNMNDLDWPPLAERRARNKLILFHKAKTKTIELSLDDLVQIDSGVETRNRQNNYLLPQSSVNSHLRLWNNLPQQIKATESPDDFKQSLEKHTIRPTYTF